MECKNFKYWKNEDFYKAVYKEKKIDFLKERKEKGLKKMTIGLCDIKKLLKLGGHNFKKVRNEYNKYRLRRKISISKINGQNLLEIKKVSWNKNKRHFMTWKGQGERFIEKNFKRYPCFIFYDENNKPIGYNGFFILNHNTLVWAVSKSSDNENGFDTYMLITFLKNLKNPKLKYLNLTSYGNQKKYKLKFNPFIEKDFFVKKWEL